MPISAKIIADSISTTGIRLTTMQLRYPKFIHGEFMTHRVFSRNASSSRAIPTKQLIMDIERDPAMPVFWGKNRPGMQAVQEMTREDQDSAIKLWNDARDFAILYAYRLYAMDAHKQIVNRVIEPWSHINVVVTATEWENFFKLRCHPDAQPEMRVLAETMREVKSKSTPVLLQVGEWHLPYVNRDVAEPEKPTGVEWSDDNDTFIKLSVARCARVSYFTHVNKIPSKEGDLKLYDRLVGSIPLHASPTEHQATPDEVVSNVVHDVNQWRSPNLHGNLIGWIQYRKTLANENVRDR